MPHFKVILFGEGIDFPFEDFARPIVGFYTTRVVRAATLAEAGRIASELVLCEWRPGGEYAQSNRGGLPALAVEQAYQISVLSGVLGRKPAGYTFFPADKPGA